MRQRGCYLRLPLGTPAIAGDAIRLGLITDRFEAGHKLKTLSYIAQNIIVLSFSDVAQDFRDIPDHLFFIRLLTNVADIAGHVAQLAAVDPSELRARLELFQQRCSVRFYLDRGGKPISCGLG